MSNALAVAAVTATLRARLFSALGGTEVSTAPPDQAPAAVNGDHVNLFLYRTDLHPSFRNEPAPGSPPGETPRPLLPLVLHYLLASYSDDENRAHQLLGSAMLALHDGPRLTPGEIQQATQAIGGAMAGSDLHLQAERVKVTHESLSQEDIARMWTAFQAPYRTSASYQVSVVLVDSARPGSAPLPVLRRGEQDRQPAARPDVTPLQSAITGLTYPVAGLDSALPGEDVDVAGINLPVGDLVARLRHLTLDLRVELPAPAPADPARDPRQLSLPAAGLAAGTWALSLAEAGAEVLLTPEVVLAVRPEVTGLAAVAAGAGAVTVTVSVAPPVQADQRASVLIGGQAVPAGLIGADTAQPAVTAPLPPGPARVRIRVDGVDSDIVDRQAVPPAFRDDDTAVVVIP